VRDLDPADCPVWVILSPSHRKSEGHQCPLFLERDRNLTGVLSVAKCHNRSLPQCGNFQFPRLVDHLVGEREQRRRHGDASGSAWSSGCTESAASPLLRNSRNWVRSGGPARPSLRRYGVRNSLQIRVRRRPQTRVRQGSPGRLTTSHITTHNGTSLPRGGKLRSRECSREQPANRGEPYDY
jgi:hypothetical protein